jgi:hypothetical protein
MRLAILANSLLALACSSLAVACGGPSVGEIAGQEVTLTLRTVASSPEIATIGDSRGGFGVTRAFVSAGAVTFEPCADNIDDLVLAPRGYELASDPPPSERITTAVYEFCGLRIDIEAAQTTIYDVPEATALYIEATDADGEPVTFASGQSTSLHFEAGAGSSFGEQPLLLGIDISTWLDGLRLDPQMALAPLELFASQLHDAATLYVDDNGNGALDDDDRALLSPSEP